MWGRPARPGPRTAPRQPPRAPCGSAMTTRTRPLSLKLPAGEMATSLWLAGQGKAITPLPQVPNRLRQRPSRTTEHGGTQPRRSFSDLKQHGVSQLALGLFGFPFSKGKPLALLSKNFGSGASTLRPSRQPVALGGLLPQSACSSQAAPAFASRRGDRSRVLRPIPGKRSGRGGERRNRADPEGLHSSSPAPGSTLSWLGVVSFTAGEGVGNSNGQMRKKIQFCNRVSSGDAEASKGGELPTR